MRAELLSCGYVKTNHNAQITMDIVKLIQLFYDKYFYWKIEKDVMKEFLEAKNEDEIQSPSTFTIRDIEFGCTVCPNGYDERYKGCVQFFIEARNVPSNIKYFIMSVEAGYDSCQKCICRFWETGQLYGNPIEKLSDFKDATKLEFYCMVDVLAIKYKQDSDEPDYKLDLKLSKQVQYEWKIDDKSLMGKIEHRGRFSLYSDNFDNDNWCIIINPRRSNDEKEHISIGLVLLRWLYGISVIYAKYSIKLEFASGKVYGGDAKQCKLEYIEWNPDNWDDLGPFSGVMSVEFADVFGDGFMNQDWIRISVEIEILNIVVDDALIEKSKWNDYGVF